LVSLGLRLRLLHLGPIGALWRRQALTCQAKVTHQLQTGRAALQARRESGREEMNQQVAGYGGAGGLGSARQALAAGNLASLQEQRQATAAANARAGVQANKASAANALMGAGQSQLAAAQQAAAGRVGLAQTPQDVLAKYASVIYGTPQASTTPNFSGTQGGTTTSKGFGVQAPKWG